MSTAARNQASALQDDLDQISGCCQTNENLSPLDAVLPNPRSPKFIRDCHSASAAERLDLYSWRLMRWRSWLKWLWTEP